jgi:nucleotide-binding universal stress UspA family protein
MSTAASFFEDPAVTLANREAQVTEQFARILGPGHGVTNTVQFGNVGSTIARFAEEHECGLIVVGRGRHGFIERLFGEEHLVRLLRSTGSPVLMVEPSLLSLPRRVVIGLDFSSRDEAAAELAMQVMAADAKVFLVHVRPDSPLVAPTSGASLAPYDESARRRVDEIKSQLALSTTRSVDTVFLSGHPGKTLSDFARDMNADLVAAGIHGTGFIHRFVVGATTTYLLRSAPCSVLAAPVPDATALKREPDQNSE